MRSLSRSNGKRSRTTTIAIAALLAEGTWTIGCGTGGASPPPPPPLVIDVTVNPANGSVVLGNQATFTATVTNTSDTAVSWSVNGVPGGNAAVGAITSAGVYTAPADMPSPARVQVTATSHSDSTKSGTGTLAITRDITLSLIPSPASVELGATQAFQATVTSSGHPDTSIRWSLSGPACANGCGTVDASGHYTAPQTLPSPASTTLTAQSVADPSKQISAAVGITSSFSIQLSAPSSVPAGGTTTIVATMTPVPGSNPGTVLIWALSGPGCSGSSCGILTVVTTQSTGGSPIADSATYTAPSTAPSPNTVMVTVTSQADPSKKAQATLAIGAGVDVSVSPSTATLAANHRVLADCVELVTHKLGYFLGFSHSAVWSAIMFPFAAQQPDAALGDDDRTGLRVLYPDPADALHSGSISGKIFPANPLALPASPPGVTGVFGAQVVAVDAASGAVMGATIGGWNCTAPGPAQFDGAYEIEGLPVGLSYTVYAEALNGAVDPSQLENAIVSLCRIRLAIRAGRRCKDAWCPLWT